MDATTAWKPWTEHDQWLWMCQVGDWYEIYHPGQYLDGWQFRDNGIVPRIFNEFCAYRFSYDWKLVGLITVG